MKIRYFIGMILTALMVLLIVKGTAVKKTKDANVLLLPGLPRPIAKEYALITSAGQNTDAYIIHDIANKLMIHNYFMPQASEMDLEGANTLVFVVGYSSIGEKLHGVNYMEEKKRITALINKSKKEKLKVITVYIGGKERRNGDTEELLSLICPQSDYMIGTKEANYDNFLSELVKKSRIPLTLVNGVKDISEPFASAFR